MTEPTTTTTGLKFISLIITILLGSILLYPNLDYQACLAQGDHGRDLYCFKKTFDGGMVYRDYWWLYGPITPYYYSLFYRLFGINIRSVLLGQNILILLCGLLIYQIVSLFTSPYCSVVSALAFWVYYPDFCHTYAYSGGVMLILCAIYFLFMYIKTQRVLYLCLDIVSLVLMALIKLNTGASAFLALITSLILRDYFKGGVIELRRNGRLYYVMAMFYGLAVLMVYLPFMYNLPEDVRAQSFTWSPAKRMFTSHPLTSSRLFVDVIIQRCISDMRYLFFFAIFLFCGAKLLLNFTRKKNIGSHCGEARIIILSLLVFSLFDLHEYFLSGALYMMNWGFPTLFLLFFITLFWGMSNSPRFLQYGIVVTIFVLTINSFLSNWVFINAHKTTEQFLDYERGKIYVNNPAEWLKTVREATDFLIQNVGEDEKIIAIPYDTLYCFLSKRDSAIRQQEMFMFGHPSLRQEQEIILCLEKHKVRWIVFSNRYRSKEQPEFGTFGETHCKLLNNYIKEHYSPVKTFGPWERDPHDWIRDHAVMMLKRSKF